MIDSGRKSKFSASKDYEEKAPITHLNEGEKKSVQNRTSNWTLWIKMISVHFNYCNDYGIWGGKIHIMFDFVFHFN